MFTAIVPHPFVDVKSKNADLKSKKCILLGIIYDGKVDSKDEGETVGFCLAGLVAEIATGKMWIADMEDILFDFSKVRDLSKPPPPMSGDEWKSGT